MPAIVPDKHVTLHLGLLFLCLVSKTEQIDSITVFMDDMSPRGLPHLRITLPIPMLSMSSRCRSGMKARSMAVVWLQPPGAKLSALKDPLSMNHRNVLRHTTHILIEVCISVKRISPRHKPRALCNTVSSK